VTQGSKNPLLARLELHRHGERVLGERSWFLFSTYGRVMSGPHSGQYVSGLPDFDVRALLDALVAGYAVDVHLMHRHKSGNYESSLVHIVAGALVMTFPDREEFA
jgi:hypothetical protein